ncbi:hypothetical protein HDU98_002316 [Podochytrium sp. JEL0797]|nr:hypothetical protein HDU98_002316 [Podochytrium sp. JEL0797]
MSAQPLDQSTLSAEALGQSTVSADHQLDPADAIIDRAKGWNEFATSLKLYFARVGEAEKERSKALTGNQKEWAQTSPPSAFGTNSSVHSLVNIFKADTTTVASKHAALQNGLELHTVPAFEAMLRNLKSKLIALEKEQKERNKQRLNDKEMVSKSLNRLRLAIADARGSVVPDSKNPGDPWLANLEVKWWLANASAHLADRNRAFTNAKADFKVFEAALIRQLKVLLIGVTSLSEIMPHKAIMSDHIQNALASLDAEKEFDDFCSSRLDKTGNEMMFESENYEGFNDPLIGIVHEGVLSRKSSLGSKELYCVATVAGYLHQFKTRPRFDNSEKVTPEESIYLGDFMLGPVGVEGRNPNEFVLTEQKERGGIFDKGPRIYKFTGPTRAAAAQFQNAIESFVEVDVDTTIQERGILPTSAPALATQSATPGNPTPAPAAATQSTTPGAYPTTAPSSANLAQTPIAVDRNATLVAA